MLNLLSLVMSAISPKDSPGVNSLTRKNSGNFFIKNSLALSISPNYSPMLSSVPLNPLAPPILINRI